MTANAEGNKCPCAVIYLPGLICFCQNYLFGVSSAKGFVLDWRLLEHDADSIEYGAGRNDPETHHSLYGAQPYDVNQGPTGDAKKDDGWQWIEPCAVWPLKMWLAPAQNEYARNSKKCIESHSRAGKYQNTFEG